MRLLVIMATVLALGHAAVRRPPGGDDEDGTAAWIEEPSRNPTEILNSLGEEEREVFVKVHLALGLNARAYDIPYAAGDALFQLPDDLNISRRQYADIQAIEVPETFSDDLLNYTMDEYNMKYDDVHVLVLYSQVCFPGEECTDVGDIGGSCCPF